MSIPEGLQKDAPGFARGWDDVWEKQEHGWWLVRFGRHIYNHWFLRLLAPYLPPGARIMELGSGTSSLGVRIAPGIGHYTGLDVAEGAIHKAERRRDALGLTNKSFIIGDLFAVPSDPTYDLVWSQGLIEHFEDPRSVVERHIDFCKPGGAVLISVPWQWSYFLPWYIVTRPSFLRRFWPWTPQRFFTHTMFRELMAGIAPDRYRSYRISVLQPFFLGIILLEIRR